MGRKQYGVMTVMLALLASFVGGMVSSLFHIGQPVFAEKTSKPQKVVEAKEFRVVDEEGKVRCEMNLSGLTFFDDNGDTRTVLEISGLTVFARNEIGLLSSSVVLGSGIRGGGEPFLALHQKGGKASVVLFFRNQEEPSFALRDKNGNTRAILGTKKLKSEQEKEILKHPLFSLVLFDEKGEVVWSAP
jgi:hypothetical protein